ncbi:MAG: hypothetical protein Q8P67_06195 [archaeon]|nr:hypothetical protein [archaeon]
MCSTALKIENRNKRRRRKESSLELEKMVNYTQPGKERREKRKEGGIIDFPLCPVKLLRGFVRVFGTHGLVSY